MDNDMTTSVVYRIATVAEWRSAQETGSVPQRDIDVKDGYMHLSTKSQALETANIHFAGHDDLLLLEIPIAPIAEFVKFELAPKRGEEFPHLYAPLKAADIARVVRLIDTPDGFKFGECL